jgi:ketosteroid isomerase-like protein
MKNSLVTLLAIVAFHTFAQTDQQQINEQVWIPFAKAIMTHDPEAFISLHSKDLIRVERDGKSVKGYEKYKKGMMEGWPKWGEYTKQNKIQNTFELRFLERHSNGEQAFEVGYFKNESINPNGEKHISYGQFHVALRKENGVWKILVDSDSRNGGSITDEMFVAADPMNK